MELQSRSRSFNASFGSSEIHFARFSDMWMRNVRWCHYQLQKIHFGLIISSRHSSQLKRMLSLVVCASILCHFSIYPQKYFPWLLMAVYTGN